MNRTPIYVFAVVFAAVFASSAAAEPVSFRRDIAPILLDNCLACHGAKKSEGGYRVDSFERFMQPGDSELAMITAKNLDESESYRRIASEDEAERMPLEGDPLPAEQVELLRRWIEEGASYDGGEAAAPLASIVPPPTHPDPPESYGRTLPITALAFSPDGKELFASGYHELTVWSPADGRLVRRIANVGQRTYAIRLRSQSGKVSEEGGQAHIAQSTSQNEPVPDTSRIGSNQDGSLIAVAGGSPGRLGETRLFNPASGELVKVLGTTADVVLDAVFSPAGDRLATAAVDGVIRVFDVASGEQQLNVTSHSDWVMALAYNADGSKLASASRDKTSKVFDATTGELLITYSGHNEAVQGVAFHPEGKDVFSSGVDKKIHRWQIEDGKKTADVGFGGEVFKLSRGGEFLFAPSADKKVKQLEAASQKEVRSYGGFGDWALSAAYHADSKRLAAGGFDGEIRVFNTEDGSEVARFVAAPGMEAAGSR